MKRRKRILLTLLVLCLLFSGVYVYSYKQIYGKYPTLETIKGEINHNIKTFKSMFNTRKQVYSTSNSKNETTSSPYKSQATMLKKLRADLVQREGKIVLYIASSKKLQGTLANDLYHQAYAYTGVGDEGDYLRFSIKKVKMVTNLLIKASKYYYTVTYNVDYRTTLAKEQKVTASVNKIVAQVNGKTTVEKINYLNNYVIRHVSYGHTDDDQCYSAYGALFHKVAVCEGYTLLFNRLLLEAGVENRVITGTAISSGQKESHAWNIIKVGNIYYDHDVTWNDTNLPNLYYLRGNDSFVRNHFANSEYTTATFVKTYPLSPTDYKNA
jgi:transglutaminase/protease-like cytokinesis protein 3